MLEECGLPHAHALPAISGPASLPLPTRIPIQCLGSDVGCWLPKCAFQSSPTSFAGSAGRLVPISLFAKISSSSLILPCHLILKICLRQVLINAFIIWPVRPRSQFPRKTIRKKVPYEGRTRRSDRAGKTRTALLERRTALLETRTAKSMGINDKNNLFAAKVCSLQNEWWKLTFWEWILLSRRTVRCRTTPKALKESQHSSQTKKFTTFSEANNEQTCRRSRKQLFWMNCPIINLWNTQTVLRRNIKASKNS